MFAACDVHDQVAKSLLNLAPADAEAVSWFGFGGVLPHLVLNASRTRSTLSASAWSVSLCEFKWLNCIGGHLHEVAIGVLAVD
jgi:hypothetical protein